MRHLLRAGFIILPAWIGLASLAGFFAEDYNPIASHVSVMTLQDGPAHIIANIAALIAGISLFLFGVGVWRLSGRSFSAGAFCWMLFGVAMIGNGIWPMGSRLHGVYIIGIFNIIAPAISLLDIRNKYLTDKLYGLTIFVSLMSVFYLWIILNGFDPEGYTGLTQRIFGSINYVWPFAFAWTYYRSQSEA